MSILILGAAGNLGGQLKLALQDREIITWDRVDFDFLDFIELKKRLQNLGPDIIINAVAYNAVDKCEVDKDEAVLAQRLNAGLPGVLADYCLEAKALLIHYSTDYVFGGDGRLSSSYKETDKPAPLSVYGQTKFAGEQEIARRALKGLDYYLIRTSKLFGPQGNSEKSKPSFFDVMLSLAKKQEVVKVVDSEISCFTYTPDLAQATKSLIDDKAGRGIYHLVNSGPVTWYEGAKYLFSSLNLKVDLQSLLPAEWPRPAKRPLFSALANTRRPVLRSWQAALDEYLKNEKLK